MMRMRISEVRQGGEETQVGGARWRSQVREEHREKAVLWLELGSVLVPILRY